MQEMKLAEASLTQALQELCSDNESAIQALQQQSEEALQQTVAELQERLCKRVGKASEEPEEDNTEGPTVEIAIAHFAGDPTGESLPDSAYFGAYMAARGIGDGVLFFAGGDASVDQLEEAISQYQTALGYFPFDRALWSTLAVALQPVIVAEPADCRRYPVDDRLLIVGQPEVHATPHPFFVRQSIRSKPARATPSTVFIPPARPGGPAATARLLGEGFLGPPLGGRGNTKEMSRKAFSWLSRYADAG